MSNKISKEQAMQITRMAYEDVMMLYAEGLGINEIKEVLELYEEKELYYSCAGIKLAIDELEKQN